MTSVIDFIPGTSLLHRLNPVTKLALAAGIILATFLGDTYPLLIALLALTFALGAYARAAGGLVSLSKLMVPLSLIMLVLQTAFIRTGNPVALWVTTDGLVTGTKAALRLLGVALPLILMLTVTSSTTWQCRGQVLHVLHRRAFTFTTALRFKMPVFSQEMNAIMEAQTARGVEYDTRTPSRRSGSCCRCACRCWSELGQARPTPAPLPPSSALLPAHAREQRLPSATPMAAADYAVLAASVALIVLGVLFWRTGFSPGGLRGRALPPVIGRQRPALFVPPMGNLRLFYCFIYCLPNNRRAISAGRPRVPVSQ